jgi:PAS domain S-box-containing protein
MYPNGFTWKAIIENKSLLYCSDVDHDTVIGPAGRRLGTKSYVSMPFSYEGKIIGTINIHSFKRNAFDEEELILLETVAQQIERAIANVRMAEALRQSEELYRILFDQSPVGVYIFDRDLKVTQCNKRMVEILQTSYDNIIGFNIRDLKDKSFLPVTEKTIQGENSYHEGLYQATTSQAQVWLSQHFSPLYDVRGNVLGGIGVAEDITERKRVEAALIENERMLSTLLSNLPGCSYRCRNDENWTLEFISDGVFTLTGYTPDDYVLNRIVSRGELIHPEDRDRVWDEVQAALERFEPFELVYRIITKSKDERWIWEKGRGIYSSTGELSHLEGFITDITEKKQLEEMLHQTQKMEAVGRLAGGIAHDFNNLLTIIISYCDLLLSCSVIDKKQQQNIREIQRAGEHAAALTSQLLAFSRKQVLQPKVLNLNEVVTDIGKMLRRLIGEDIELVTTLETGLGRVKADPGQIEQVIMNLVINARDAMPAGGKLLIQTANVCLDETFTRANLDVNPGQYVMLAVSDTGHGMDKKTLSHIFEPFYTTKQLGKGTGLGLATVYGVINQSGGHISVDSEINRGTTFKIYLPAVEDSPERKQENIPVKKRPQGVPETILIAEDQDEVLTLVGMILNDAGYKILEANHCDVASQICAAYPERIHLLLVDMVMPKMSGPELADRLMALHPEMKIIYMSGYTDDTINQYGVIKQGKAFLQKPFTPTDLLNKVREVLDAP